MMGTCRARKAVCTLAVVIAFSLTSPAHANGLTNYYAKLYEYFSHIEALPIRAPQAEEPGDVYTTPGHIYLRKKDCFDDLTAAEHETILATVLQISKSDVAGTLDAEAKQIGTAGAKHSIKFDDIAEMSFGHPAGHPKIKQIDHGAIVAALTQRSSQSPCRVALLKVLRGDPGDNVEKGVPWIIESVWYASSNLSIRTIENVDSAAHAKLEGELRPSAGVNVEVRRAGNGLVVVATGKTAFPVAWRPAFISSKHYNDIRDLSNKSWFRWFKSKIGLAKSDQDILLMLRKEFNLDLQKEVPRPLDIDKLMSQGPSIEFDSKNKEHLEYITNTAVYYALSWEVHKKP